MDSQERPKLYRGWKVERWDTPVSNARSLRLVSLVDSGDGLVLTLEDGADAKRRRWQFQFANVVAYLNLLEEYRLELWSMRTDDAHPGWTTIIPDSPWASVLRQAESLVEIHHPALTHFQIGTEDDVIDVLAPNPPEIAEIGPPPTEAPEAGKSTTLYWPKDRERVETALDGILTSNRQHPDRDA